MLRFLVVLVAAAVVAPLPASAPAAAADPRPTGTKLRAPLGEPGEELVALRRAARITGVARLGRTLRVRPATWSVEPDRVGYRWLRDGELVPGASGRRRTLTVADLGHRMSVLVTAQRTGQPGVRAVSDRTRRVGHRARARHTVTYHVETRGRVVADRAEFRRQAHQTLEDPRGWRGAGVRFRRVASGGDLTLLLSAAPRLPSFSPVCSVRWSCRVGRFVVINQTRWLHASPMWNRRSRSLRDYRHMVVNHEVGHWLGHDHRRCPRRGGLAPVMQTQSKGLGGCRPNPWPTPSERSLPRFR